MVVEVIHVEDIFELVSLVLCLIISWTFRILAHEGYQYTVMFRFFAIAIKQTNAGPFLFVGYYKSPMKPSKLESAEISI